MAAGLTLLPRKAFELICTDGTIIPGQFSTWSLKRFGDKKKLGLNDLVTIFSSNPSLSDMLDYVVCAVEYRERQAGKPPTFNELKLSEWIDDYTFDTKEEGVLMKLFEHAGGEEKEKKNPQESSLNGESYKELQLAQE